jgi:hypothetical protein
MPLATRLPAVFLVAIVLVAAVAAGPLGSAGVTAHPGGVAQQTFTYRLPHLVSAGFSPTLALADVRDGHAARPLGMVSYGESTVELQNLARRRAPVTMDLHSMDLFDDVSLPVALGSLESTAVALRNVSAVTFSNYAALIWSGEPLGIVARASWEGGAMAAYEAAPVAKELIVPLFAVNAYSHTSLLQLTNTSPTEYDDVRLEIYDTDGHEVHGWTVRLEAGASGRLDPAYEAEFRMLPVNVGGGFLGAVRLLCDEDTAAMVYGDEPLGRGVSAYVARPPEAADVVQYLPLVRANLGGDSLIALTNIAQAAIDVTITYLGAPNSPSGAGQTYQQTFTVDPRHFEFVDLDADRRRGSVSPPGVPRGSGRGRGFFGSATVRATGPILATSLEQDAREIEPTGVYTVLTSAAYNAFGTADLSRDWIVPRAFTGQGGRTTDVVFMNPGTVPVTVRVEWGRLGAAMRGSSGPITVAPGQIGAVTVAPGEGGDPVQAVVRASSPVAALVYDLGAGIDLSAYWPVPAPDGLIDNVPTSATPRTATPTPTVPTATPTRPVPSVTPTTPLPTVASPTVDPPTWTVTPSPTEATDVTIHLPVAYRGRR